MKMLAVEEKRNNVCKSVHDCVICGSVEDYASNDYGYSLLIRIEGIVQDLFP